MEWNTHRFSHSIGVSHLANEMYNKIIRNSGIRPDSMRQLAVSTSGLLHDIGHGPFSHTMEELLEEIDIDFDHEKMTIKIIEENETINQLLRNVDEKFPEEIIAFFDKSHRKNDHWTYRLISSQLDADRIDYLLRDSHNAGLHGHGFDVPRLLDMLYAWKDEMIVVYRHATEAVEAYLVMLEHLYRVIYFHRGVRGAVVLLRSVIKRAVYLYRNDKSNIFLDSSHRNANPVRLLIDRGENIDIEDYIRMCEFHVWYLIEEWQYNDDKILSDLAKRLIQRKRFRSIDYDAAAMSRKQRKWEEQIADIVSKSLSFCTKEEALEYYVVVDDPSRTGYRTYNWVTSDQKPELKDESIWLFKDGENPEPIENESNNQIFNALKRITYFNRMMFPHEIYASILEVTK